MLNGERRGNASQVFSIQHGPRFSCHRGTLAFCKRFDLESHTAEKSGVEISFVVSEKEGRGGPSRSYLHHRFAFKKVRRMTSCNKIQ